MSPSLLAALLTGSALAILWAAKFLLQTMVQYKSMAVHISSTTSLSEPSTSCSNGAVFASATTPGLDNNAAATATATATAQVELHARKSLQAIALDRWPQGLTACYLCGMAAASYCFMLTATTVVTALQCSSWQPPVNPLVGEVLLGNTLYWTQDLGVVCFKGPHAALVVVVVLVGIPGMLLYLLLLGVACYSVIRHYMPSTQQQQPWQQQVGLITAPAACSSPPPLPAYAAAAAGAVGGCCSALGGQGLPPAAAVATNDSSCLNPVASDNGAAAAAGGGYGGIAGEGMFSAAVTVAAGGSNSSAAAGSSCAAAAAAAAPKGDQSSAFIQLQQQQQRTAQQQQQQQTAQQRYPVTQQQPLQQHDAMVATNNLDQPCLPMPSPPPQQQQQEQQQQQQSFLLPSTTPVHQQGMEPLLSPNPPLKSPPGYQPHPGVSPVAVPPLAADVLGASEPNSCPAASQGPLHNQPQQQQFLHLGGGPATQPTAANGSKFTSTSEAKASEGSLQKLLWLLSGGGAWELLLTGFAWQACWWVVLREVGKVVVALGIGLLRGRSSGAQAVVVMGIMGGLAIAQALMQPWGLAWLRRRGELQAAGVVAMSVLLCGVVVGGGREEVALAMSVLVLLVAGGVSLLLIGKLAGLRFDKRGCRNSS